MPANDKEVFDYFRKDASTLAEVDYLAYASYAFDKFAWMEKFTELTGAPASAAQVDHWIAQLPDSRLDEIQQAAVDYFDRAARTYMKPETERAIEEAVNRSILSAVQSATSFKQTFWPNLFVGIVASFAFAVIIIVASSIFARDPSPLALYKAIVPNQSAPSATQLPEPGR
jgi:hypothetical protein